MTQLFPDGPFGTAAWLRLRARGPAADVGVARVVATSDNDDVELVARAAVVVRAPRRAVWRALMAPETIPQIMPVTAVVAAWALGERFVWTFALGGNESRVEGRVHRVEENRLLDYDFADPHSREVLGIDNVHRVVIELTDEEGGTRVSVMQDANLSEAARAHAEGGWRLALNNLEKLVGREA